MATITDVMQKEIEKVVNEMCDGYCKWPEIYLSWHKDPDEAHEQMMEDKCINCPLSRI